MDDWIHRPTTNVEICGVIPNCKFYLYSNLWKIRNVNDLLPKSIILYQTAKVGHWIGIFKNREGLNIYDSLGFMPDHELSNVPPSIRRELHEDYTYLTALLSQSNYIVYNEYRHQRKGTSTCGMHVAHRLMYSYMTNDEYNDDMQRIKDKDKYVANYFKNLLYNV